MSKNLADLHPNILPSCKLHLHDCQVNNIDARISFTYRTPEEQDEIYAQGRTKPGKKVTNLKGSQSKHCVTLNGKPAAKAYDIAIYDMNGNYITDGSHELYTKAGELGKLRGLTWGGDFKSIFDPSHFEIP